MTDTDTEIPRYETQTAKITVSRRLCDYTPFREYVLERLRELRDEHADLTSDEDGEALEEVYVNFDAYTAGEVAEEMAEADPNINVNDVAGYTCTIRCAVHEDLLGERDEYGGDEYDFLEAWARDVSQSLLEI